MNEDMQRWHADAKVLQQGQVCEATRPGMQHATCNAQSHALSSTLHVFSILNSLNMFVLRLGNLKENKKQTPSLLPLSLVSEFNAADWTRPVNDGRAFFQHGKTDNPNSIGGGTILIVL